MARQLQITGPGGHLGVPAAVRARATRSSPGCERVRCAVSGGFHTPFWREQRAPGRCARPRDFLPERAGRARSYPPPKCATLTSGTGGALARQLVFTVRFNQSIEPSWPTEAPDHALEWGPATSSWIMRGSSSRAAARHRDPQAGRRTDRCFGGRWSHRRRKRALVTTPRGKKGPW